MLLVSIKIVVFDLLLTAYCKFIKQDIIAYAIFRGNLDLVGPKVDAIYLLI